MSYILAYILSKAGFHNHVGEVCRLGRMLNACECMINIVTRAKSRGTGLFLVSSNNDDNDEGI